MKAAFGLQDPTLTVILLQCEYCLPCVCDMRLWSIVQFVGCYFTVTTD